MKKLHCVFSLLIFFCYNSLHAQIAPSIEWQKSFGGLGHDSPYSIHQTSDGGFIIAGSTESNDGDVSGFHFCWYYDECPDYWIVKLDSIGNLLWEKCFGGSGADKAYCIQQCTDGGFIVAGYSQSADGDVTGIHLGWNGDPSTDYWIIRLDSIGDLLWQKCFGGSRDDIATSVEQTSDGGFVVAGYANSIDGDVSGNHGGGTDDYWILKLDVDGNMIWQKCLGGDYNEFATSIQQTANGGYIVTGRTETSNSSGDISGFHGVADYWIVKLDSAGSIVWKKCLGGLGPDEANSVEQANDGGFIIAGYAMSNDGNISGDHLDGGGNPSADYWIVKLDTLGNLLWQKCFGGSSFEIAYSIHQTTDGGFVVAGNSASPDGDVTGWQVQYDYYGEPVPDAWIVKLDSVGNLLWQECLGTSSSEEAYSIQQTSDSGFIVAIANGNYWIVKLSFDIPTSIMPSIINPISLHPNPTHNFLTIDLATQVANAIISVYDLQGRIINIPTSNFKSQTSNSIQLSTENLPAGFYTLQIINNKTGESEVGKFVKE